MAGYNWYYGMSNNAVAAYYNGKVPKSKITKALLEHYGISLKLSEIRLAIEYGIIDSDEYHHTSKYFNVTYFYDLKDIKDREEEIKEELIPIISVKKEENKIKRFAKKLGAKEDDMIFRFTNKKMAAKFISFIKKGKFENEVFCFLWDDKKTVEIHVSQKTMP